MFQLQLCIVSMSDDIDGSIFWVQVAIFLALQQSLQSLLHLQICLLSRIPVEC